MIYLYWEAWEWKMWLYVAAGLGGRCVSLEVMCVCGMGGVGFVDQVWPKPEVWGSWFLCGEL